MTKLRDTNTALNMAFQEAQRSKRLVWLCLEASWNEEFRTWQREVWDDPRVAQLRESFVVVRLERDVVPDLDQAAQFVLQTLASRSGWPAQLFLTPEGRAVFGATSLTVDGLVKLGGQLAQAWALDRSSLERQAEEQRHTLLARDPLAVTRAESTMDAKEMNEWLDGKMLGGLLAPLEQSVDFETGFIGQGQVYHYPAVYKALLANPETARWAELGLTNLAKSHICDVLGGGFFRSAGREPTQPVATEKLLIEQAEFLEAYVSWRDEAHSEFLVQVASETLRCVLEEFALSGGGFAASLSASSPYYRVSPADLLEALPGESRQAGQMFFGIEGANRVPFLQTDLPMLASFLNVGPVDLQHRLVDAKKRLLHLRVHRSARPERGPRLRAPEATLAHALVCVADRGNRVFAPQKVADILFPLLDRWPSDEAPADAHTPRAHWAETRAWLAGARLALGLGDRARGLSYLAMADEFIQSHLDLASITTNSPFAGERLDFLDHMGSSAGALRLHALLDRIEFARREGDKRASDFCRSVLEPLLAQSLKIARPLGLYSASIYEALARFNAMGLKS